MAPDFDDTLGFRTGFIISQPRAVDILAIVATVILWVNKTFSDKPFTGIDIELQYPPYRDGKPLGNWSEYGEILSITFQNEKGETRHWSQAENTLDFKGNHITSNGGLYNISTGEYKEPPKKIEQEWDETRKILNKPSGIHR